MCWPACRRARSAGFPTSSPASPRAASSADLPLALRRCGYNTISLYPAYGAFMSARGFQTTTGIQHFLRRARSRRQGHRARQLLLRQGAEADRRSSRPNTPLFIFVYLAANHFPWETRFRPDLMPSWREPGNEPVVDEYLRRQAMSADDYAAFIARAEEEVSGAAVPDRALRRSSAGILVAYPRSRSRRGRRRQEVRATTIRAISRPITRSTPSISSR